MLPGQRALVAHPTPNRSRGKPRIRARGEERNWSPPRRTRRSSNCHTGWISDPGVVRPWSDHLEAANLSRKPTQAAWEPNRAWTTPIPHGRDRSRSSSSSSLPPSELATPPDPPRPLPRPRRQLRPQPRSLPRRQPSLKSGERLRYRPRRPPPSMVFSVPASGMDRSRSQCQMAAPCAGCTKMTCSMWL